MAINKEAIIDAVFQGAGKVAKNPIPPTIWSYNDAVKDDPYDPEAAKKLLEEAGVTDLKTSVWAMPVQRPYNPNARRMAELIQADRSEEHTSELQSLMRISYAVFCLKKKKIVII